MLKDLADVCSSKMTVRDFAKKYNTGINKTRRAKKAWLEAKKSGEAISSAAIEDILHPKDDSE